MIELLRIFLLYEFVPLLLVALLMAAFTHKYPLPERTARYLLLLSVGVGHLLAAVRNFFFYAETNALIGLDPSHFQFKVGLADLGLGIVGILAFRKSFSFCLGSGLYYIVFAGGLWLAYLNQLLAGNAPTHSFWVFTTKSIILVLLAFSLYFWRQKERA